MLGVESGCNGGRPTSSSGAPRCPAMKAEGSIQPRVSSRYPGPTKGVVNWRISKCRCAQYLPFAVPTVAIRSPRLTFCFGFTRIWSRCA